MRSRITPIALLQGGPVPVHLLADQEFCELKVDIELRTPGIDAALRAEPALASRFEHIEAAKALHRSVASPAAAVSPEEVREVLSSGRPFTLVESPVRGEFGGVPILGFPDAVHSDGSGGVWIVEYKVRNSNYLSPSDDAQLRLYGFLLLQDQRFTVDQLWLVRVRLPRESASHIELMPPEQRAAVAAKLCVRPPAAALAVSRRYSSELSLGAGALALRTVTFAYDHEKALSELNFLTGYWRGVRLPMPTRNATKCAACRVNAIGACSAAQAPWGSATSRRSRRR